MRAPFQTIKIGGPLSHFGIIQDHRRGDTLIPKLLKHLSKLITFTKSFPRL